MANHRKYTDQQFIEAVKQGKSVRQVLGLLGLREAGGNYRCCKERIKNMKLDTSHFSGGRAWSKGRKFGPKQKIEVYLVKDSSIQSFQLKNKLLAAGILLPKCYNCGGIKWLDKPMPLELEHIDGDSRNNLLENLTLLCPNCHAFTSTYRGKNIGSCGRIRTDTVFVLSEMPPA